MFLRIEDLPLTHLVGQRITTTLANDQTLHLWQRFMPRRMEIKATDSPVLYAVQVFSHKGEFTPETPFEKWATLAVHTYQDVPDEMETLDLPAGQYAVFLYRGLAKDFGQLLAYIFGTWLPQSAYELDNRPQFELLGDGYKRNDPSSEEEVWIPIRTKAK